MPKEKAKTLTIIFLIQPSTVFELNITRASEPADAQYRANRSP